MISLTERLKAAAELVPQGVSVIDIGTDHARLPIYLLLSGKSPRVCAADINRGPLSRAEENARRYGAAVDTLLSDGFSGVTERFGCACICGMGGELISSIIGAAAYVRCGKTAEIPLGRRLFRYCGDVRLRGKTAVHRYEGGKYRRAGGVFVFRSVSR